MKNHHPWFALILFALASNTGLGAAEIRAPSGDRDVVPLDAKVEELWNAGEFTEGVAVAPDGRIHFSDIPRSGRKGRVMAYDPRSGKTAVYCQDSRKSNGLMFDRSGRLIAVCGANTGARALCEIGTKGEVKTLVDRFAGKALNSPNDLIFHPNGTVYFSDPRYAGSEPVELPHMSIYLFDPKAGSLRRATTQVTKPNGVELSPDARTLYVSDTDGGTATDSTKGVVNTASLRFLLKAFSVRPDGNLENGRVLVDFGNQPGIDGLTVDDKGRIYAAVRTPDRFGIRVYTPDGREIAEIPTPVLPTNCCFGIGPEHSTLYITAGGGLYRVRLKPKGYHPFFKD